MPWRDFQILGELGGGKWSTVYKVRRIYDQQIYALKQVTLPHLTPKQLDNTLNEIRILASIVHPNIISYKDCFLQPTTSSLCLVTEYADCGDLSHHINQCKQSSTAMDQKYIWNVLNSISKGLKCLHSASIIHRDLKSANVFLFSDGHVKLGDMNLSKVLSNTLCYTQTGTPYYASPEVWKDIPYNHKSDIWSLGCILYEMLQLKLPFESTSIEGLYKKVTKGIYGKLNEHYSKDIKNIIRMMLNTNMQYRPSIGQPFYNLDHILIACTKALHHPNQSDQPRNICLLSTIKIYKHKQNIKFKLPKSKYNSTNKTNIQALPSIEHKLKPKKSFSSPKILSQNFPPIINSHKESKQSSSNKSILEQMP